MNNISQDYKLIFIHVPKTAGMAISSAVGLLSPKHDTQQEIIKQAQSYDLDISKYFQFAFIRNPWDRFLSLYFYLKFGSDRWPSDRSNNLIRSLNFNSFCSNFEIGNLVTSPFVSERHYKAQLEFIDLSKIDFIGRFEKIQKDFNFVCDSVEINRHQLPYNNKTKHKHYTEYYDDETRQIVAEKYAKDIEHFGYKFGE